jgi:mono/diheme cytochrome c family protein
MRLFSLISVLALSSIGYAADAEAGKAVYMKACRGCHGADGTPNAGIAKSQKVEMRHLGDAEVQKMSDADLTKAITEGFGKMKPVKSVSAAQAADVVAFMRTLKK